MLRGERDMSDIDNKTSTDSGIHVEKEDLNRALKSRHIQMIALGAAIGVGLFYGAGSVIGNAGPSALFGYVFVGIAIFIIMRCLGEMSVQEPVSGGYVSFTSRYIHPFFAWYMIWTGIIVTLMVAGAEFIAVGDYLRVWWPNCPIWVGPAVMIVIILVINISVVKAYGELEFWLSLIKVVAIIAMILVGLMIIIFGVGNGGEPVGISNIWKHGGLFPNGIGGWVSSLMFIVFAFSGTEFVANAAGEAADPAKTIRSAINQVTLRILIFYIGSIFVILAIFPWNEIGTFGSPFVAVFSQVGIPFAGDILNIVCISAVLSMLNSVMYSSSRQWFNMSLQGEAPKALSKKSKNNIPIGGVLLLLAVDVTGIIITLALVYSDTPDPFATFTSVSVFNMMATWIFILIAHLNFRKKYTKAGKLDEIKFKAPGYPILNYVALAQLVFIAVTMCMNPGTRIGMIIGPILMGVAYVIYRTVWVRFKAKNQAIAEASQVDEQ
jgi:AAT family amino acid transporter